MSLTADGCPSVSSGIRPSEQRLLRLLAAAGSVARQRGVQVSAVHLRLGALSGVVKDALLFCYEVACQDTPLAGSRLIVEDVPVVVFCSRCNDTRVLGSVQSFSCPECNTPTMDVRKGKELEVFALEVEE